MHAYSILHVMITPNIPFLLGVWRAGQIILVTTVQNLKEPPLQSNHLNEALVALVATSLSPWPTASFGTSKAGNALYLNCSTYFNILGMMAALFNIEFVQTIPKNKYEKDIFFGPKNPTYFVASATSNAECWTKTIVDRSTTAEEVNKVHVLGRRNGWKGQC